ncbi:MAG: carboxypeptidase regulatory-like domain-containing protein [Acidobacteria bacterium]|nr:carboxypeptidase regulatory-like domain-containing protein [Acidobacteriota bacterium]
MPNALTRVMFVSLSLLACGGAGAPSAAQTAAAKEAPASVSGRVTNGEKGVPGIEVILTPPDPTSRIKAAARAMSDAEGRFRMTGVPPGRYQLMAVAPAYVVSDMTGWPPGRNVNLSPGDAVEDLNFTITRGGVITGRVTDSEGKPVIGEQVQVASADESKGQGGDFMGGPGRTTDDRGIYRVYGLAAGRYRVSVGQDRNSGMIRMGGPRRFYRLTFHPEATEREKAKIVEVAEGGETEDVDISVAKASRTFKAEGRFVSAETGRPVPDVQFGFGTVNAEAKRVGAFGFTGQKTNARGEFQVEQLAPGRYAVFGIGGDQEVDWYSDTATFEIDDADATGVEVKIHRGSTLSGVVQIEGVRDRAALAKLLQEANLTANVETRPNELGAPRWGRAKIAPDGSFLLKGLRPGKLRLLLGWPPVKGLSLLRVEREGIEQREGMEIAEGAQVSGVRVVLAYGSAVIRGQVNITGGALAQGARLLVSARRVSATGGPPAVQPVEVDTRGRFVLEGLAAGEYELQLNLFPPTHQTRPPLKQSITVGDGGEMQVTLVFDLSAANKGGTP